MTLPQPITSCRRHRRLIEGTKVLRLLHLVSLNSIGGIQRDFTHFINTRLPGRFVEHHVLLSRPGIAKSIEAEIVRGAASIDVIHQIAGIRIPSWLKGCRHWLLTRAMQRVSPDAVVLWSNPRGLRGFCLPPATALIYYEHGAVWFNRAADEIRDEVSRFDGIVCNSQASARMLGLRWGVADSERIRVCLNAVQAAGLASATARHLDPARPFVIGIAGRLESLKGFALVLHALKALVDSGRDVRLDVAGVGPELESLRQLTQTLGVADCVRFLEFVDAMSDFYRDIDLFVCPSIREPFGLVAAEAMAHGLPVVCAAVDGLPEVVEHEVSGVCLVPTRVIADYPALGGRLEGVPDAVYDPDKDRISPPRLLDPPVIAEAIDAIISNPSRYAALSRGALERARSRLDYVGHVKQVLDAIDDCAKAHAGARGGQDK